MFSLSYQITIFCDPKCRCASFHSLSNSRTLPFSLSLSVRNIHTIIFEFYPSSDQNTHFKTFIYHRCPNNMNKCKSILSLLDICCCSIRKLVVLGERRELYCPLWWEEWWGYVLGCVSFSRARIVLSRVLFLSPLVEYAGTGSRSLANDRRPGCTL